MVRHNTAKQGKFREYTQEGKVAAINMVATEGSWTAVSRLLDIPRTTIQYWCLNPNAVVGVGRNCVFSRKEEDKFVDVIVYMGEEGLPMGREKIKDMVQEVMHTTGKNTAQHPFGVVGRPGPDWMLSFERRNRRITRRVREGLAYSRTTSLTPENVNKFYDLFEELNVKYKFKAQNIWNCDETGFQPCRAKAKVYVGSEYKHAYSMQPNAGKAMTTVLFNCNAAGDYTPPH